MIFLGACLILITFDGDDKKMRIMTDDSCIGKKTGCSEGEKTGRQGEGGRGKGGGVEGRGWGGQGV